MRLPHGIRRRLTLSLLLVFVLGLGAVAAFSHVEMRWAEERLRQRALETHAREFLAGLSVSGDGRVAIALLPDWEEPYRQPGAAFAFTLYDAAGRPVLLSPNLGRPLPLIELPPGEVYGRMRALEADERVALAARAPDGHTLVVARGRTVFAVLNLYPSNAGHLMVVPYRHVPDYTDLTDAEVAELGAVTQTAMRVVRAVSGAHGFNIGMNQGSVAGAGIADHLHQHAVPRWGGDTNFMPVIGLTRVLPQVLRETRALLAANWPAGDAGED